MKDIRDLDEYPFRFASGWEARSPERAELSAMRTVAENSVGVPLAPTPVLERLYGSGSARFVSFDHDGNSAGGSAALFLSHRGQASLTDGSFDFRNPHEDDLVREGETPAAIYWWVIWGNKVTSHALPGLIQIFKENNNRQADIYAVPFTVLGERFLTRLGFQAFECRVPRMMRYMRQQQGKYDHAEIQTEAIFDSHRSRSRGHDADRFDQIGHLHG